MSPRRGSPTGDELRAQAWHGLGNGIASLYWFNLSMKSLAKFPDLLEPIARVGTEIELLRSILETGTAYRYERILTDDKPSWDLSSIVCDDAALFVVNDLDYRIDDKTRTFEFLTRTGQWSFQLPPWLRVAQHCFRVDADGVHEVTYRIADGKVTIEDKVQVVGVYVVTRDAKYREILTKKLEAIQQRATELGFDPIHDPEALAKLKAWVD